MIEISTADRPRAFASLREQTRITINARDAGGQRFQRQTNTTVVKPIPGFARCRFVYTSYTDLACYLGTSLPDTDQEAISKRLEEIGDNLGQCLTNSNSKRAASEEGSTQSITYGGGARQPFWQISMVPTPEDISRLQPEIMVLGPATSTAPLATRRSAAKAKTKRKAN